MKKTRTYVYPFCGEIEWDLVNDAVKEIYSNYLTDKFDRLIFPISTAGGDADAAWSLYTTLKNIGCEVITIANGRVFSAGIIIFLGGSKRYAFPESCFLFHPTTIFSSHNENAAIYQIEEEITGEKMDNNLFQEILKKELTAATKQDISRLTHRYKSYFIGANEAKQLGLVHNIIKNINNL